MKHVLGAIAKKLWPDFDELPDPDQSRLLIELYGTMFSLPWVVVSLMWLIRSTDMELIRSHWQLMLVFLGTSIVLSRFYFFQIVNMGGERPGYTSSNLADIPLISSYFIFGPTAVWLYVITTLVDYVTRRRRFFSRILKWNWNRNLAYNLGITPLAILLGLSLYTAVGGQFPVVGDRLSELLIATIAAAVYWSIDGLVFLAWALSVYRLVLLPEFQETVYGNLARQSFVFLMIAHVPGAFGILGALIFIQMGLWIYLFFIMGVLLVSVLTRRLSEAVVLSQQKTSELDHLEQLGRAIIEAPADASTLPQLLLEYVPRMFTYQQIEIRFLQGETLLQLPETRPPLGEAIWTWLENNPRYQEFSFGEMVPWTDDVNHHHLFLTPIMSSTTQEYLGGICVVQSSIAYDDIPTELRPSLEVLAAQIASALNAAKVFEQSLEHEKVAQELAFAGEIQASFLPDEIPHLDGWQIAAQLSPARETSGDFYDLIPLPNGSLGIVVADVTDKGLGAALFMALSRTLIRSYAFQHPDNPARGVSEANQRILTDAKSDLLVTSFYGVLNPLSGVLTFSNAGHNPPFLFAPDVEMQSEALRATGVPLGVLQDGAWKQSVIKVDPGNTLVLYSDGITEAQNLAEEFYGEERLMREVMAKLELDADGLKESLLSSVKDFLDEAPIADDITLVIVRRE